MDSSKELDEISDRLFVNSFFNIGLTKKQVCNISIEKKYQNLFDRLKLKLGRWTDFHHLSTDGKEI
jgi:3'-phosphoadenosine 5'-phosphosulfate sulfotransferase